MKIKPISRKQNIVVQEFEKELLIYDLQTNKVFCLNETSAMVYQLCDGKNSIADISNSIAKKLNQPINNELIWLALDGLKKENLLENSEQFEIDFNGLNRRQIIRKVGLASMIALPMVSSVVAPSAANAASGVAGCASPTCMRSGPVCNGCFQPTFVIEYNSTDGSC
ncbi:MAG TPA: PqqD family protein, partial [Pyrinomonadaceae bacterium]|nr:PqqD family protein [Pyrinomonadaceae bacterium]